MNDAIAVQIVEAGKNSGFEFGFVVLFPAADRAVSSRRTGGAD
jgi:hypothetical protein